MKRLLCLLVIMLVVMSIFMVFAAPALAVDTDTSPVIPADDFFTWSMLATYSGAVAATILITQLFKEVGFLSRVPTRIFSYFVAVIVLILATLFSGFLTLSSGVICLFNAAVVSLAANGAVDLKKQLTSTKTS